MPYIRLLTSVQGDGPVAGDTGDVLEVPRAIARRWADGQRAEVATAADREAHLKRLSGELDEPVAEVELVPTPSEDAGPTGPNARRSPLEEVLDDVHIEDVAHLQPAEWLGEQDGKGVTDDGGVVQAAAGPNAVSIEE